MSTEPTSHMIEALSPQGERAARCDSVDACTRTPSAIGARRAPVAEGFLRLYRRRASRRRAKSQLHRLGARVGGSWPPERVRFKWGETKVRGAWAGSRGVENAPRATGRVGGEKGGDVKYSN